MVLVTGVAGFIGFHLSKHLLNNGEQVLGFDNLNSYYDVQLKQVRLDILKRYGAFNFVLGDLADRSVVDSLFSEFKPEIVINLAAQAGVRYSITNPQVYIDSNITGFFNILEACRHNPVDRLIFASSSSVYGNQQKIPFSETDNVDNPISLYAATKRANELMAYTYSHLYNINCTGLRFFTVYGEYGRPDMAYFSFAEKIMRGEAIQLYNNGDMLRDFTYIDDVVRGINALLNKPAKKYEIFNIGNNNPVKLMDFVSVLENAIGHKAIIEYLPMQQGDVYQTYADIEKANHDFGFSPNTDLKTGLEKFARWFMEWIKQS